MVFVAVAHSRNGYNPGLFYSRAFFGNDGKIVDWSPWSCAAVTCAQDGTAESVLGAHYDPYKDDFILMVPTPDGNAMTIKRTSWHSRQFAGGVGCKPERCKPRARVGLSGACSLLRRAALPGLLLFAYGTLNALSSDCKRHTSCSCDYMLYGYLLARL